MWQPRKHQPLVSVLVPCFGAQATVARTINSVLHQTHDRIEAILAPDDGDTYAAIRATCKSPRLRIIPPCEQSRTGPGETRNRAIDASEGDFFCMLDADDVIPPNYVATLVAMAERDGAATAPTHYTSEDDTVIRVPPIHPGVLTLSGFAQILASIHVLVHRSLEPGFVSGFSQDVVRDGLIMARTGGVGVATETHYTLRLCAQSVCGTARESDIQMAYAGRIDDITRRPSKLGVHQLSLRDQELFADVFRFRAFVSRLFASRPVLNVGYHAFVGGREAEMWDAYRARNHAVLNTTQFNQVESTA